MNILSIMADIISIIGAIISIITLNKVSSLDKSSTNNKIKGTTITGDYVGRDKVEKN